jgi:hypothetical protein
VTLAGLLLLGSLVPTANARFTAQTRSSGWSWTVAQWTQPYVQAVLNDSPAFFWLVDEQVGTAAAQDRSGHRILGSYKSAAELGRAGGLPNNPGTAVGTSGGVALTTASTLAPTSSHTIELWFKSGSAFGGHLSSFATTSLFGLLTNEDRIVKLTSSGKITYGDWLTTPYGVITTPGSYNDNAWHQVVVTATPAGSGTQNSVIYVDGVARASGVTSRVDTAAGNVRIAGGAGLFGFSVTIDNVSVYDVALSAQRVAAHYAAR